MNSAVISTRIRLARNLADFPFPVRMTDQQKIELVNTVCKAAQSIMDFDKINMSDISQTQAIALVERHFISPEFIKNTVGKTLLLSKDKTVAIMLNEEDHIRLQVIKPDLCLKEAYEIADQFDNKLSQMLKFAYNEKLGYLTQCPTNLGTGMRASVMIHLPALQKSHALSKIASNLSKLGMTIRGLYGESSEPKGAMYQLSNQVSLGINELSAVENLKNIATELVTQEIKARDRMITDIEVLDTICRSLGILKTARIINHVDAMNLLSNVRLGVAQNVLETLTLQSIDELVRDIQPANILERFSDDLSVKERDIKRADYLREKLN